MSNPGSAGRRQAPAPPEDPDSVIAAQEVAVRILTAAAQSAAALERRLVGRGFSPEVAAAATAAMVARGYVDDAVLASAIATRRQRTGHGRIQVGAELRARGVTPEAISATLADVDIEDERAAALKLGRHLAQRASNDITSRQGRQRLGGALQRRGFDSETVSWVLRELERQS
ncbi:MAG TPA: RecX family transcriptional regulator [Candidatus Dormibacteraeota bacterium]|nr:RecX family transcriptional regulator [Candidatus Dormibacteraeota bacterium]